MWGNKTHDYVQLWLMESEIQFGIGWKDYVEVVI